MNESPRYRLNRDKRICDPRRYLYDRLRECDAMIAHWERSRNPEAPDDLHYWRRTRFDLLQTIAQIERADKAGTDGT